MKRAPILLMLLFCCMALSPGLDSQEGQSLGDLARKERERRKAQSTPKKIITDDDLGTARRPVPPGKIEVENDGVGLRLRIPQEWKVEYMPASGQYAIDCAPERPFQCSVWVTSADVPSSMTTISDAERKTWDTGQHAFIAGSVHKLSSRDFEVSGLPAHEVIVQENEVPNSRWRYVYVLATNVGHLYDFAFHATREAKDDLDANASAFEDVLQSFAPLARPAEGQAKNLRFAPEEQAALFNMLFVCAEETVCKAGLGTYVSWEKLFEGCASQGGSMQIERKDDPRKDPNFDYTIEISGDRLEVSAAPRRAGLGGFLCDGRDIHYNPKGRASVTDPVMPKDAPNP